MKIVIDIETSYLNIGQYRIGIGENRKYKSLTPEIMNKITSRFYFKELYVLLLNENNETIGTIENLEYFIDFFQQNHSNITHIIGYNTHYDLYILNYIFHKRELIHLPPLLNSIQSVCLMSKQITIYYTLYKLETYYNKIFNQNKSITHSAKIDCRLTYRLYKYILQHTPTHLSYKYLTFI